MQEKICGMSKSRRFSFKEENSEGVIIVPFLPR